MKNVLKVFLTKNMHDISPGDKITIESHTPLHFAALFGRLNICKLIIEELTD